MNHQPYEDWLLSDEPLLPEQSRDLQTHLRMCDSCQQLFESWSEVQNLFNVAPSVQPKAGFSTRWLIRLEEEERKTKQRQSWMMLILTGGVALFILLLISINVFTSIDQPIQLLFLGTSKLTEILSALNAINEILSAFVELVSILIPPMWWIVIVAGISLLGLLWLYSLKQLMQPRRMLL